MTPSVRPAGLDRVLPIRAGHRQEINVGQVTALMNKAGHMTPRAAQVYRHRRVDMLRHVRRKAAPLPPSRAGDLCLPGMVSE